jgi:type II secretory ATPase GspE/PulE/Tfp pilus assembly ATPase PilB-like protein
MCNYSGYKGYNVIYEIFLMDKELRNMIINKSNLRYIREKAIEKGMETFQKKALELMKNKTTTIEEVIRVIGLETVREPIVY